MAAGSVLASILREAANRPLLRMRTSFAEANHAWLVDAASPYAVLRAGGALGFISANATWMMPPASPSATPIRQAMV